MWTSTTKLHLLNAISLYGPRKLSYIGAYLKVYAKISSNNWKKEYNKMIREYIKNKESTESVREYFQKKRKQVIDSIIEKKREEKSRIIERMIYGYDSMENSEEESDDMFLRCPEQKITCEIMEMGEPSSSSFFGVKGHNTLSTTLFHLSTLGNLPPHLELPGPKPEAPSMSWDNTSSFSFPGNREDSFDGQCAASNLKDQKLEDLLTSLENSNHGVSVSAIDSEVFERFFKWTLDRLSQIEMRKREEEEMQRKREEDAAKENKKESNAPSCFLREYYSLDFHDYPKKKSPRDKGRWVSEFSLLLTQLKTLFNGTFTCEAHKEEVELKKDGTKQGRRKIACIKCFDADVLKHELENDHKPSISEYVFRSMLFLQSIIMHIPLSFSFIKEIELIKGEFYRFYEYYRK
ncbi:hypothetical protein NEFER03_1265 [Nematocida sp. LUAm3]|nr:hypothetical protein NEFER03_1265 [Nematocida sp. LUAm3]KAI5174113.1 hypothetical protein NEFER02_0580 [Nematocida sp. LUAm2]KAI5177144.1 hypothetical protein NEFER01_0419 [Nematocida sp. LUAm1]